MDALEEQSIGSILAVDCGSLYTRVLLIDIVADEYRFVGSGVAPTTAEAPYADITIGVYNALADLEATTGRRLVEGGRLVTPQHADGHGVDVCVATCSAAPAIRLVVAGITNDFSTRAARVAAAGTYTHLLDTISVDEPVAEPAPGALAPKAPAPPRTWAAAQFDKLIALAPDAVLLAGGVEGGPVAPLLRLADVVVRTVDAQRKREQQVALVGGSVAPPPLLFFAGNSQALAPVQAALGDAASVVALPNLQPTLDTLQAGPVRDALLNLYQRKQLPALPGMDELRAWSRREIAPTVQAVELVTRYISLEYHREVLAADIGAACTALVVAGGPDSARYGTTVRGNFGLAQGLTNLLAAAGPAAVLRWLPFICTAEELESWALNRVVRPFALAQTARDLAIEHAFAREALRSVLTDLRAGQDLPTAGYDLLIGTGGLLANAPRVGQAALILLDALEPTGGGVGSLEIALDSTLMLPALGALAPVHPGAAAYLFDRDCLVLLGTCIVPLGSASGGALAVEVTVEYAEAGSLTIEVPYGTIEVIPLRPEQRASLRVKPGAAFRIGSDEPGKQVQTKPGEEIKGGLIGLIVDARGRPLVLPDDPTTRIAKLLEWGRALRAYLPRETFDAQPGAADPGLAGGAGLPDMAPYTGPGAFTPRPGVAGSPGSAAPAPELPAPGAPAVPEAQPAPAPIGVPAAAGPETRRRPGSGGLRLPSLGGGGAGRPATGPLPGTEPAGAQIAPAPERRRTGNTGKLHLPTIGEEGGERKGTAPLQWPQKDED